MESSAASIQLHHPVPEPSSSALINPTLAVDSAPTATSDSATVEPRAPTPTIQRRSSSSTDPDMSTNPVTAPPPPPPVPTADHPSEAEDDSASEHNDSDDDDDDDGDDDEDSPHIRWRAIEEDKTEPCEDEMQYISSKDEHSALDDEYWEKLVFEELDDPGILAVGNGVIDWNIDAFNGTKDNPNKELVMRSAKVSIAGLDWQIKFYPHGNRSEFLSVYLECTSMLSDDYTETDDFDPPPFPFLAGAKRLQRNRPVAVQLAVIMYNPTEPRVYEFQHEVHNFHKASADYGWKYFSQYTRYEFHTRRHGQRVAILQDDKLAFRAYIRVLDDTTGCLWQHDNMSADRMTAVTGLRPFAKSMRHLASIIPLLHFRPFRDLVKRLDQQTEIGRWLHAVLLKMYTRKRSKLYCMVGSAPEGDAVELLFRISAGIRKEYTGQPEVLSALDDLLGRFPIEKGMACGPNRLRTVKWPSVQDAINRHNEEIATPVLLTLELERQQHDKKKRSWKKITTKVQVEDKITVAGTEYILYSFITHCGTLQSGRYNSYVRPHGLGKGWYAYSDGRVVRLTEKQAREKHAGGDQEDSEEVPEEDPPFLGYHDSFRALAEVPCALMYVRADKAEEVFSAPTEEEWESPPMEERKTTSAEDGPAKMITEESQRNLQGLFEGIYPPQDSKPLDSAPVSDSEQRDTPLTRFEMIERSAAAATPEPPALMDGEDVVMRDVDGRNEPDEPDTDPAAAASASSTISATITVIPSSDTPHLETGTVDWLGRPYYHGQWKSGQYHGHGHLIATNGDEYTGAFQSGQPAGHGRMTYAATGDVYDGEWADGAHHGRGRLTEAATGNVFAGGWRRGRTHGAFVLSGDVSPDDRSQCTICYDRDIATAFYDCGHVLACRECADLVDVCPVCRKRVVARLQLYGVKMTLA